MSNIENKTMAFRLEMFHTPPNLQERKCQGTAMRGPSLLFPTQAKGCLKWCNKSFYYLLWSKKCWMFKRDSEKEAALKTGIHWILACFRALQVSLCVFDYSKASDRANHEKLCAALRGTGMPEHMTVLMCNNTER